MKYFFYIFIPLLVCFNVTFGQLKIIPLRSDPHRQSTANTNISAGSRMATASALTAVPQVKDTLELPFFDDFTSLAPPINTIYIDNILSPTGIVKIRTYGLHGLNNGDKVYLSGGRKDTLLADKVNGDTLLNGAWFAKRIDALTFTLYQESSLITPLVGNSNVFTMDEFPIWVKAGAKLSPNPDSLKWANGGGAYINNRFCVDPPSYSVATFDGLDANGKSYSSSLAYTPGFTDTLTSLPINLLPVQASDSLYLSFYYQRGGLGEAPDHVDSLYLEFKDKLGVWNNVWSKRGADSSELFFTQNFIVITNPNYFYKGFQFRFRAQGEKNGSFDVWNVDYIHLDTNRSIMNQAHDNVSLQKASISLLKKYTAMPFEQFFFGGNTVNNKDLIDSIAVTYNSLRISGLPVSFDKTDSRLTNGTGNIIQNLPIIAGPNTTINPSTKVVRYFKIDPSSIIKPVNQYNLKLIYSTAIPGVNNLQEYGVDYRCNDTITGYTVLKDYYAYDDSTAEWSIALNASAGKVAVEFDLNSQDTLVGIDIYFPHIEQNRTATSLDLLTWSQITPIEQILGTTSVALSYSANNNQFKRFILNKEIIVKDSVFIGYRQGVNFDVPIGFDLNTNSHGRMYYNVTSQWVLSNKIGSIMMRPVFKNSGNIVSGLLKPVQPVAVLDCEVYPNPTTGTLNILGDIKDATLTDLSGRMILEQTFSVQDIYKTMELQNIPTGFYLLRLSNPKASAIKKIILVK